MLVLSQALDNAAEDECVIGGVRISASAPEARPVIARLFDVVQSGAARRFGATQITQDGPTIAVKASTFTRDNLGRNSPLYILLDNEPPARLDDLSRDVMKAAQLLGRQLDADALEADLKLWAATGKAHRGHRFRRLRRLIHRLGRLLPG
ncbi:hypothetical protein [Geodermatophilus sp. SYSU D01119]